VRLDCPRCGRVLEFSGERPSFCAYCGQALADTVPETATAGRFHEAATLPPDQAGAAAAEAAPQTVGGYRLVRLLGRGGMGEVYEAEDPATGRRVAVKLIAGEYAGSADTVQRFRQEGRLASALAHPRCVFVLAADEEAGRPYIVMELMPGTTLDDVVTRDGPLPPEQAVARTLDLIEGLQAAHRLGVIHRDVKPSNCFVGADGRVKVGDFGLAKSLLGDTHLTRTGAFLGTPLFASPEQIRREALDAQTDVYSVAATLYYLLTGRAPFQGGDAAAVIARIVSDAPPPARGLRPELPPALDRVVLRGLERHRKQRWRDLEEFRLALLPFVPGTLNAAGLGVRFGAYLIDYLVLAVVIALLVPQADVPARAPTRSPGSSVTLDTAMAELARLHPGEVLLTHLASMALWLLYFGVPEGIWGWSPGKKLLGLRVRMARGVEAPGIGRAMLRAFVVWLLPGLGGHVFVASLFLAPAPLTIVLLSLISAPLNIVGIGLIPCTMRARNGYRGLHEFLSGTRVVWLPRARPRWTPPVRPLVADDSLPQDLPTRLGPFETCGALPGPPGSRLLLCRDPSLGREAVVWLRPPGQPLDAARRDLNRPTRLRWLAGSRLEGQDWDAFLAPVGCPLPALVTEGRPLSWTRVRPLLEQLADELTAAEADRTLPDMLTAEQVWVQPDGGLLLLDRPLGVPADCPPEGDQPPTLALLGRVATLALGGAPLPLHAAQIVSRLAAGPARYQQLEQFQADLRATCDSTTEVTRARRAAHLGIMAACLLIPFAASVAAFIAAFYGSPPFDSVALASRHVLGGQAVRRDLEAGAARDLAGAAINPDAQVRLAGACRWLADQRLAQRLREHLADERRELQARMDYLSQPGRLLLSLPAKGLEESAADAAGEPETADFRALAEAASRPAPPRAPSSVPVPAMIVLAVWLCGWVLAAFAARGGVTFAIAGFRVVRSDGRPASRVRCAWRALLAWAPVAGLLLAGVWLDAWHLAHGGSQGGDAWLTWLADAAWWVGLGLLPLYAAVALWLPARGPHDRLAGTCLVPR
jgi:hypothetical protein